MRLLRDRASPKTQLQARGVGFPVRVQRPRRIPDPCNGCASGRVAGVTRRGLVLARSALAPLARMQLQVVLQQALAHECERAQGARKRLVPGVRLHVVDPGGPVDKRFAARLADERALPRVNAQVVLEVCPVPEPGAAHVAHVGLGGEVRRQVRFELGDLGELLVAHVALQELGLDVVPAVARQEVLVLGRVAAGVAGEGVDARQLRRGSVLVAVSLVVGWSGGRRGRNEWGLVCDETRGASGQLRYNLVTTDLVTADIRL